MGDQTPHAGQDSENNSAPDEVVSLTRSELTALIRAEAAATANSAITNHERRRKQDTPAPIPIADTQPNPKAPSDSDRFARLEREVAAAKKERDDERARNAENRRDQALRSQLESRGFRSPDIALAALKGRLTVEEGEYIHEGADGLSIPIAEVIDGFAKSEPWMIAESGKGGGGAVGTGARNGTKPVCPPGLYGEDRIIWAKENGVE